jgi:hypothetical protein
MRRAICLLAFLFGSWSSGLGQSAPKFTTPRIVATFQRLGQTANIPPTTIYRPKNWGTFRVSIVLVETVTDGNSPARWAAEVDYADGAGDTNNITVDQLVQARGTASLQNPIRAKAGKPLTFKVNLEDGDEQGAKYNVWVVVEQLM